MMGLGVLVALCVSLLLGFHIWFDYFRLLREVGAHGQSYGASPLLMNNLRTILYRALPTAAVDPVVYVALLGSAVGVFWLWRSVRDFDLRFALTVLVGLIVAPHLNYQDTFVSILPAVITYDFAQRKKPRLLPWLRLLIPASTILPALLIFTGSRTLRWIWPLPLMLILLGVCARALRKDKTDAAQPSVSQEAA